MSIFSMTGYASAQAELQPDTADASSSPAAPSLRIGMEIRSVNSRFLDLSFKFPEELRPPRSRLARVGDEAHQTRQGRSARQR